MITKSKKPLAVGFRVKMQQVLGRRACGYHLGGETYLHDIIAHFGHFGEKEERKHTRDDTKRPGCGSSVFGEGAVSWNGLWKKVRS